MAGLHSFDEDPDHHEKKARSRSATKHKVIFGSASESEKPDRDPQH